jgi:hypothetical protein
MRGPIENAAKRAAEEFRLYSYKVDRLSGDVLPDVVDGHNHCIEAARYALAPRIKTPPGYCFLAYMEEELRKRRAADGAAQGACHFQHHRFSRPSGQSPRCALR